MELLNENIEYNKILTLMREYDKFIKQISSNTIFICEYQTDNNNFMRIMHKDLIDNLHDSIISYLHIDSKNFDIHSKYSYEKHKTYLYYVLDKLNHIKCDFYKNVNNINQLVINSFSEKNFLHNEKKYNNATITIIPFETKLLHRIKKDPAQLHKITSSEFELLISELYNQLGFAVKHTKLTHDGGKDIVLTSKNQFDDFIYYVECKHYSKEKPIGIGIVRQFSGTVLGEKINGGIIVTSSYFSKPSQDFINENNLQYLIKMQDASDIYKLINSLSI